MCEQSPKCTISEVYSLDGIHPDVRKADLAIGTTDDGRNLVQLSVALCGTSGSEIFQARHEIHESHISEIDLAKGKGINGIAKRLGFSV